MLLLVLENYCGIMLLRIDDRNKGTLVRCRFVYKLDAIFLVRTSI